MQIECIESYSNARISNRFSIKFILRKSYGKTTCLGRYFMDFRGVLLFLIFSQSSSPSLLLYSQYYAEMCKELSGPISVSSRGSTTFRRGRLGAGRLGAGTFRRLDF